MRSVGAAYYWRSARSLCKSQALSKGHLILCRRLGLTRLVQPVVTAPRTGTMTAARLVEPPRLTIRLPACPRHATYPHTPASQGATQQPQRVAVQSRHAEPQSRFPAPMSFHPARAISAFWNQQHQPHSSSESLHTSGTQTVAVYNYRQAPYIPLPIRIHPPHVRQHRPALRREQRRIEQRIGSRPGPVRDLQERNERRVPRQARRARHPG
jgi:hypothetical protein